MEAWPTGPVVVMGHGERLAQMYHTSFTNSVSDLRRASRGYRIGCAGYVDKYGWQGQLLVLQPQLLRLIKPEVRIERLLNMTGKGSRLCYKPNYLG